MSRRYAEPVDVRRRDEEPVQFVWRGRLYVVRAVLAHWRQTGAWWRGPAARALRAGVDRTAAVEPAAPDLEGAADPGAGEHVPAVDTGEREVWRVEASRGRTGPGVFDLSFDWTSGRWSLVRALD